MNRIELIKILFVYTVEVEFVWQFLLLAGFNFTLYPMLR